MKFQPGNYKTRDGGEARVYATDGGSGGNLIHGALLCRGAWISQTWYSDGRMVSNENCPEDLRPPKREMWVNVYASSEGGAWPTKERADEVSSGVLTVRIARVRLEYEEGQFDE